jgi:2-isopropylmalate synthase
MVSTLTGLLVQRNKAIVGENAFAHEAGIHQDGVLKYRETYEIMDPATVGIPKTRWCWANTRAAMRSSDRVTFLGYKLTDEQIEAAFVKFKALADKKKEVFDEDIEALVDEQLEVTTSLWEW